MTPLLATLAWSGGHAAVPTPPAPPARPAPPAFVPEEDRPPPRFRALMTTAQPYLTLLREVDGDGGRFAPAYVPEVQIEAKGSDAGKKRPGQCKGRTVQAIVRYVAAPTRIQEFAGTLVDCVPTGIGVIKIGTDELWAGQVRGYAEGKRPGLAIAAGEGILKKGGKYWLTQLSGTPAVQFVPTQQEALNGMPGTGQRGSTALFAGTKPGSVVLINSGWSGPATILLRSGAEFDGRYDGTVFNATGKTIRYPERGITLVGQTDFVGGLSSNMPWLQYNLFAIETSQKIGHLPAGIYRSTTVSDRNSLVQRTSDGRRFLVSGANIERTLRDRPQAFKPRIDRDPSMLARAGTNIRNCRSVAFPAGYTPWWPGCVPPGLGEDEQVMAFNTEGGEMAWKRSLQNGAEHFKLVLGQQPRKTRSSSSTVQVNSITADRFAPNPDGELQPKGNASALLGDAMGLAVKYRGEFYGSLPHGKGFCKEQDGPEEPCSFDVGVRTDSGYVARYAAWRAEEDIKVAEQQLKEAERQAQLERQRQQAAEAAERQRIADENYRRQEEQRRRAERLAQLEEEETTPQRNYIAEAIQEIGQKFQQAAVENQRNWDEVNRINRQTEEYNRRQREMVQRQNEANALAAQQRASAASQANAQLAQQRREAEQRLAEARARAAMARQQALAPRPTTAGRPMAPTIIGNERQSMMALAQPRPVAQPPAATKSHPQVREASFLCLAHPTRGAGYYHCWGVQDNRRHFVGPGEAGGWHSPESLNRIVGCPNGSGPRSVNDGGVYWACGFGADGRHNRDAVAAAQADGHGVQLSLGTYYCSPGETACRRRTPTGP